MLDWLFGPRYPLCRRAIVNLKSKTTFRGVLWARRGPYMVIRNAELLRPRGEVTPVDGELVVPAADIEFMQLLDGA